MQSTYREPLSLSTNARTHSTLKALTDLGSGRPRQAGVEDRVGKTLSSVLICRWLRADGHLLSFPPRGR